jgi:hypothetical protein
LTKFEYENNLISATLRLLYQVSKCQVLMHVSRNFGKWSPTNLKGSNLQPKGPFGDVSERFMESNSLLARNPEVSLPAKLFPAGTDLWQRK